MVSYLINEMHKAAQSNVGSWGAVSPLMGSSGSLRGSVGRDCTGSCRRDGR